MRIVARRALREFREKHRDAEEPLKAWYANVKEAHWQTPADVNLLYRTASLLGINRVVFNIKGNRYRLVTAVDYRFGIVYIRFIGTHQEYEKIDATTT
jgi:mRNA interferase HigB